MLVLSRKLNEEIVIDGRVSVRIVAVDAVRVRLGIEAPPGVRVNRREVEERPQENAARPPPSDRQMVILSTADSQPSLDDQLDAVIVHSHESVTLDFSCVAHIVNTGLSKVVGLHHRVRVAGGHLLLQNLRPLVRAVFVAAMLDGFLTLSP